MPKSLSIIDRVQTTSPCTADWDSMTGNDQVRFCEHCAKDVHNISAMTRKQLKNWSQSRMADCV